MKPWFAPRGFSVLVLLIAMEVGIRSVRGDAFGDAVGQPALIWTSSGDKSWIVETSVTHDGVSAVKSGAIGNSQKSALSATVNGPIVLKFWWKVSSEHSDYLTFTATYGANQTITRQTSREVDWQLMTLTLGPGPNVISWTYSKDRSVSEGQDAGWVDEIAFEDVPPAAPAITNPTFPITKLAGSTISLGASVTGSPLAFQWVRNGTLIPGATQATLTLTNAGAEATGHYQLVVSNQLGVAKSKDMVVYVAQPRVFTLLASAKLTNGPVRSIGFAPRRTKATSSSTRGGIRPAGIDLNSGHGNDPWAMVAHAFGGLGDGFGPYKFTSEIGPINSDSNASPTADVTQVGDSTVELMDDLSVAVYPTNPKTAETSNNSGTLISGRCESITSTTCFGMDFLLAETTQPPGLSLYSVPKGQLMSTSASPVSTYTGEPFGSGTVTSVAAKGNRVAIATATTIYLMTITPEGTLKLLRQLPKDPTFNTGANKVEVEADEPTENEPGTLGAVGNTFVTFYSFTEAGGFGTRGNCLPSDYFQRSATVTDLALSGSLAGIACAGGDLLLADTGMIHDPDAFNAPLFVASVKCGSTPKAPTLVANDGNLWLTGCDDQVNLYACTAAGGPPEIVFPPSDQALTTESTAELGVTAAGDGALKYQWFKVDRAGGSPVKIATPSGTTPILKLDRLDNGPKVGPAAGEYFVVVGDSAGHEVTSTHATVSMASGASVGLTLGRNAAGDVVISLPPGLESWTFEVNTADPANPAAWKAFQLPVAIVNGVKTLTLPAASLVDRQMWIRAVSPP